jgi:hypothetical protein
MGAGDGQAYLSNGPIWKRVGGDGQGDPVKWPNDGKWDEKREITR